MKILPTFFMVFVSISCFAQISIYTQNISASSMQAYTMRSFQGQKILVFILPSGQLAVDSAFLLRIDSINLAHKGKLKSIAVPAIDFGYAQDSAGNLAKWYQSMLDPSIIISQPVVTNGTTSDKQNSLFSWLTHAGQNIHFNYTITGTGTMFFVDESGALYGVFGPEAMFSDKIIKMMFE